MVGKGTFGNAIVVRRKSDGERYLYCWCGRPLISLMRRFISKEIDLAKLNEKEKRAADTEVA